MKAEYKNWVPKEMIAGFGAATAVFTAAALGTGVLGKVHKLPLTTALAVGAIGCGAFTAWCTFAIHDIMSKSRFGDMQKFVSELKAEGYEEVKLIDTTNGKFMTKKKQES